jgi:uncharacterized repeat protein (TIGR02543 family)
MTRGNALLFHASESSGGKPRAEKDEEKMKNSKRLFSKDMLILGFVLQLRFMFLAVIFSIFAGGYLYAATPVLIAEENFEGVMSCKLSSVGSFPVSPGIKTGMGVGGSSAYGFGRSSCGGEAWDGYVNDLTFTFSKKCVITKVEFWEIERYENWGSQGWLIANGNKINDTTFGRLPSNDRIADSSFRKREFSLDIVSSGITFRCWDITDRSELFVDDIKIYGYIYDDTFTVAFNANGGVGDAIPIQGFSVNTPQKIFKNVYIKDGYVFQGWVSNSVERAELAAAGVIAVDYRDEELITVDSDMTLYAVWANPPMTLTAESANWSNGSITLRCEDTDKSSTEHSYTLEYCNENGTWVAVDDAQKSVTRGQNANNEEVWVASLTDSDFSLRLGGIPPVSYRVKDENGRVSDPCVTRNRYGLFVGVGHYSAAYQAKIKIRRGWPLSELPEIEGNTRRYSNLARSNGGFNVTELIETDAKVKKVDDALVDIAEKVVHGDICLFYASTHGDFDSNVAVLRFYDDDYTDSRLRTGTDLIAAKGAAVVCVLAACCSEAMVRQSTANVAVIAAANYKGSTTALFDEILWDYGWKDGWAGTGASLTFGDLSDYVANRYNAIFDGITLNGPDGAETWNVQVDNAPLLARITAGTRGTHASQTPPSAPSNVNADRAVQRDRITVSWDGDPDTDNYFIFFGGTGGGAYDDFEETPAVNKAKFKMEFIADDYECVERSSENAPVPFMIRAFNGAGVSTSAYAQGWLDTLRRVTFDPKGGTFIGQISGERLVLNYRKDDALGVLPRPAKDGFTFAYWYRSNVSAGMPEMITEDTEVTDDVTYYAWWTDMTTTYLDRHPTIAAVSGGDIATAAAMTAANGCRTVGECYALGINPEDPNDDLKISHFEIKDGKPVITLNHTEDGSGNSFMPRVKTLGKANLDDAHEEWREVPAEGDPSLRFFKVEVELP